MKKATLLDIAKAVNVSKTTVSLVLNNKNINVSEKTRKEILDTAKKLNYIPNSLARGLSTKKTNTIGFIVPDIENPYFSEMAKAIEVEAEKLGYSMILCNTLNSVEKEEKNARLLMSKLVDGVIICPIGEKSNSINMLKINDVPFVVLDRKIIGEKIINGVFCDNKYGIKLGIDYLIKNNKKSIGFIGGKREGREVDPRLTYFCEVANQYGILKKEIIFEEEISLIGGIMGTEKILKTENKVDAIFYSSDIMAIGGIKSLMRKDISIPKDISILGYDNIGICSYIEPELTTIGQPIYEMGKESLNLLIDIINSNASNGKEIILKPYIVERQTVK
ncbi:hypothetical protein HMPREF1092_01345 [Clostridium thermobutyricum]|uniref:HTH lacI-type domain-containing protein n=1 Tax=Clostridium thermobutyricum TaxID=29372 RepID=N9WGW8_9CLOT|nr:LacI family DNA-binding transcriptional regulator [Clostridium thermobutyricum]ENZ02110.1 hypothetical protein HMPREF1092_01345 [Clostridium thermobutyricum]